MPANPGAAPAFLHRVKVHDMIQHLPQHQNTAWTGGVGAINMQEIDRVERPERLPLGIAGQSAAFNRGVQRKFVEMIVAGWLRGNGAAKDLARGLALLAAQGSWKNFCLISPEESR